MKVKPQVILRMQDKYGVHLIKKYSDGYYSIEGHSPEGAKSHNVTVPGYFFPLRESDVAEYFKEEGKEFRTEKESAS